MLRKLAVLFGILSFAAQANHYKVTFLEDQDALQVEVCFDQQVTDLVSNNRKAKRYLDMASGFGFSRQSSHLAADKGVSGCPSYRVNLNDARKDRLAYKVGNSWLVNTHSWLWLPKDPTTTAINFYRQDNTLMTVSAPWRKRGDTYFVGNTPSSWTSRIAFGDLAVKQISLADNILNVAILDTASTERQKHYLMWLKEAASAIANLYGRFPLSEVQILVVPIGAQREAIPWAEVQRNGHPGVHFFVDPYRPIEEFRADWTATHELSHLLLPRIAYRDRWLSEGLASYYQYVAKAQAGLLSEEQAWMKLTAGFERGRKKADRPLISAKHTRHAYWGGAGIFLLADIMLRNQAKPQSLNSVLDKFAHTHLPSDRLWHAEELIAELDAISQTDVFTTLYSEQASKLAFPIDKNAEQTLDPKINPLVQRILTSID